MMFRLVASSFSAENVGGNDSPPHSWTICQECGGDGFCATLLHQAMHEECGGDGFCATLTHRAVAKNVGEIERPPH
jgi:hypothetical protein